MNKEPQLSFSNAQRWRIGANVLVSIAAAVVVLVAVNILAARHYRTWDVAGGSDPSLAPLTLRVLGAITNQVEVTVLFDRRSPTFSSVSRLLERMVRHSDWLQVEYVDYLRFPARAEKVRVERNLLPSDTGDRVIFHSKDRTRVVYARDLSEFDYSQMLTQRTIRRIAFKGEQLFASALFGLIDADPVTVYCLQGHGEQDPEDTDDQMGFSNLKTSLEELNLKVKTLVLDSNTIPADCRLLVVANPTSPLSSAEAAIIQNYLSRGGRMLAQFTFSSLFRPPTGLEAILEKWGVRVGRNYLVDRAQSDSDEPGVSILGEFGDHPIVKPLRRSRLYMVAPRSMELMAAGSGDSNPPKVTPLLFTGADGVAVSPRKAHEREGRLPAAVAIEKQGDVLAGVGLPGTRIVVVGDSLFLGNKLIDQLANRDFARLSVNWLLDRDLLLGGIGPQAIREFTLTLTQAQMQTVRWLFLGVIPGSVFLFGGWIWYRRRF